ncbi:MAG: UDP-N-acetylglucosamine 2-epimerase, partial [Bacteroidota bacterium]
TGSLSMDNLRSLKLLTIPEIHERFQIDLSIPTILITFHPETVLFERNKEYVEELIAALKEIDEYQFLITMPNADTLGNMIRSKLQDFIKTSKNAIGVESLGTLGYLSCMKNCAFMLGNTSSGFIEAAYFPKYVVNIGTRQQGRIVTENIRNCAIQKADILDAIKLFDNFRPSKKIDIYGDGFAAQKMIKILKTI